MVEGKCVPIAQKGGHTDECPEGQEMVDGKCVPKKQASDTPPAPAPAAVPNADDLVKMVTAAVTAAVKPVDEKLDGVIVKQHATEQEIKKMAGETPESNVTPAGSTEPIAKRENANDWKTQIGRDPEEIAALEKEDLIF